MSRGWKRYGEARLYLIGGTVGLLAILWSALFVSDQQAADSSAAAASAGATESLSSSSSSHSPASTPKPQTTTKGS